MGMTNPFAPWERTAGATFVERCGVEVPDRYGNAELEYRAVRAGVGLVDCSFRGLLRLAGGERLRWLNGQITNEVAALTAGDGVLAAVLNAKGHVVSDLAVYGLDDSVWIDLPRDRAEAVRNAFEQHIVADDVHVEGIGDRFGHLMLAGPGASSLLADVVDESVRGLSPWRHAEVRIGDVPLRVVASRWLATPGFDLMLPAEDAGRVWDALRGAGREAGLCPVGMTALEVLRIEAGWPWYGVDFDESNLLMEGLTGEYVSFTKGCYVGQEVVTRIEHQGHLNKKLCGLVLDGAVIPARGTPIHSGDRVVGRVTSAAPSPVLGRVIALGFLRRECWATGTRLGVGSGATSVEARVAALPFVGPDAVGRTEATE